MASAISYVFILVVYFGCPNVLAEPCTADQAMSCVSGLSDIDFTNIGATCGFINSMTECITNLENTCDLNEQIKANVEKSQESLKAVKAMCPGSGSSCSIEEITGCVKISQTVPDSMAKMCEMNKNMETCLKDLLNKCDNAQMKETITKTLSDMDSTCGTGESGSSSCSLMAKSKCTESMVKLVDSKPTTQMCDATKDTLECLRALKSNCGGNDLEKEIAKDIKTLSSSMSDDCCQALVKIKEECDGVEKILKDSEDTSCMKMESAFNCIKDRSPKCDSGPMKKGIDDGLKEISQHLDSCKNKGYDVKVDYAMHMKAEKSEKKNTDDGDDDSNPDDSGTTLKQSLAVVVSAFLVVLFSISF